MRANPSQDLVLEISKKIKTLIRSRFQGMYWCAHKIVKHPLWQYLFWSFQGRDTELESFFVKIQLWSNGIIEF